MKKTNVFKCELDRRKNGNDDVYKMIGTELKRRRTNQSQTLSSIASDVCSVSYLCKVEKNQLKPNRWMLQEICKRLNIDSPKFNLLFELQEYINKAMEALYNDDESTILELYNKSRSFENYRSKLIELIFHISRLEIYEADSISKQLLSLASVMKDEELNCFILLYAIVLFYEENYAEALDNLLVVVDNMRQESYCFISLFYIFSCYFKMNHPATLVYGQKLIAFLIEHSKMEKMDRIKYILGLYYIKNKMLLEAEEIIKNIREEQFGNTLSLFVNLSKRVTCSYNKELVLRPFARLLYAHFFNYEEYRKIFSSISLKEQMSIDFNINIASYYCIEIEEERYQEIINVYLPNIKKTNNGFDKIFFLNELCRFSFSYGRYKAFAKAYEALSIDGDEK